MKRTKKISPKAPEALENQSMNRKKTHINKHRQRGVAAILSMMFLVILGSLAAAMAIVSQGNLATADSHLKINRSLAAAETGVRFMIFRLNQATQLVTTPVGEITGVVAPNLWNQTSAILQPSLNADVHYDDPTGGANMDPTGTILVVDPISLGPGQPTFSATFTPHPIAGENYNAAFYQRPPYNALATPVSAGNPLDTTWIRLAVLASDNTGAQPVTRTIQMDFQMEKRIRFAVLSRSRVMIGRNVMIDGPIGSRFTETHLPNGHPIQMISDFRGLNPTLDNDLTVLVNTLALNDANGDNRLNLNNSAEVAGIIDPGQLDYNGDSHIDEYDFFLSHYDDPTNNPLANGDGAVSATELDITDINRAQLFELIDKFGDPGRYGYGDGIIDNQDRYAKIRGQVKLTSDLLSWQNGAANNQYQDYFQGPIHPDNGDDPLIFQAPDNQVHSFTPQDFDMTTFRARAMGGDTLIIQATNQAGTNPTSDPTLPLLDTTGNVIEEVPYGAAHPYDYYSRPVYENMTFTDVMIPKGTNAVFKNCKFVGVTFVESTVHNTDPNFNYAGIAESDGTLKFPNLTADVNGTTLVDTKSESNNLRFHGCTFEGAVISDAPPAFTHIRNKISFTGPTKFDIDGSTTLSASDKKLFKRSTILTPHYSVEMGTFNDPTSTTEKVNLSGTIVSGVIDIRGQVDINGSILTTFEPTSNQGPVIGNTSPQFNTTLGYFPSADGDLEAELPATGIGVIHIRYDPTLALPDGITGPIEISPIIGTYHEGAVF